MTWGYRRLPKWRPALLVLACAAVVAAGAQEGERRVVFVNVLNNRGNLLTGLGTKNFAGALRGQPVTIISSVADAAPRRLAVVIDVSGSERESGLRQWAWAEQLIDRLVPDQRVALFTINGTLTRYSDFSTDGDSLVKALHDAYAHGAEGNTSLYDGIAEVAGDMPNPRPGDAICLISDGDDVSSRHSETETAQIVAGKGIRVFLIGDAHEPLTNGLMQSKAKWKEMTVATGGRMIWINPVTQNAQTQARMISEVAAMIAVGYRIELLLPGAFEKVRDWDLHVTDSDGRPLKDIELLYPRLLVPRSPY